MRLFSKIFSAVFTVLFVWAALVQYNDPDALMWYLIYGIAAVASFLFFLGKLNLLIPVLLSFAYIEHARESLGLIINALVMLFYAWKVKVVRG